MKSYKLKGVFYALIIFSVSLTLLQGYFQLFTRLWLTTSVGVFIAFLLSKDFIRKKSFPLLILYLLFVLLNLMLGDGYFSKAGNVALEANSLLLVCLIYYGLEKDSNTINQSIVIYSFIFVLIATTIGSYFADIISPGIIRQAFGANATGTDRSLLTEFYKMGMSNYSLPHAIPVIIPGIVFGLRCSSKYHKLLRILLSFTLLCLLVLSYLSSSTTALLFSIFSLAMSLVLKNGKVRSNIVRIILLLIFVSPILFSKNLQLSVLNNLDEMIGENIYFHLKVEYFQESITNENSNVMDSRGYLYDLSIDEFVSHPFLGTNNEIGGHSSLLDRLANPKIKFKKPFGLGKMINYSILLGLQWVC